MRPNEVRIVFQEVLRVPCPECHVTRGEICDTQHFWVHLDRITAAEVENDRYLRIAAVKPHKIPVREENIGDRYAAFAKNALDFNEVFLAFDRLSMETSPQAQPGVPIRRLFLDLAEVVQKMFENFGRFSALYAEQDELDPVLGRKYLELVESVNELTLSYTYFLAAFEKEAEQDDAPEELTLPTVARMADIFTQLSEDFLRFSLEYNLLRQTLLRRNLSRSLGLLAEGFDDQE